MANVLAVFAQFERRLIAERTKAALAIKRAQGVRLGRPASIPDELAKRIVRMRERGLTLQAICDRLGPVSSWTSRGEGMAPAISESCLGPEDRAQRRWSPERASSGRRNTLGVRSLSSGLRRLDR